MRVIVKEPGVPAKWRWVDNDLKALQEAVGGYIETVTITSDAVLILDEEGRLKGKEYNMTLLGVDIVGTFLVVGKKEDEFTDCPLPAMRVLFGVSA